MKRRPALLCLLAGVVLLLAGFLYDIFFAGIPYQDPTPEMSASYARHARIASTIRYAGLLAFLTGVVIRILRLIGTRTRTGKEPGSVEK